MYDVCFRVIAKSNARLRFFCCQFYFLLHWVFIPIDTMQHWWWLEKALLAVTCWYQHWHTHIYMVYVYIHLTLVCRCMLGDKSSHMLHTSKLASEAQFSVKITILCRTQLWMLRPLNPGQNFCQLNLLPRSALFSTALCSIDIALHFMS